MDFWGILRLNLFLAGGLLASGGIVVLSKNIKQQYDGIAANATILELKSSCEMSRYASAQKKWNKEAIDCSALAELKRAHSSDENVMVWQTDIAQVEFPLKTGATFKTSLNLQPYLRTGGTLSAGDRIAVFYDPKNPKVARAPLGWLDVGVLLAIFAFGAICLVVGLKLKTPGQSEPDTDTPPAPAVPNTRTARALPVRQPRTMSGSAARPVATGFGRR
jgi:hypothetical protein